MKAYSITPEAWQLVRKRTKSSNVAWPPSAAASQNGHTGYSFRAVAKQRKQCLERLWLHEQSEAGIDVGQETCEEEGEEDSSSGSDTDEVEDSDMEEGAAEAQAGVAYAPLGEQQKAVQTCL